MSFKDNLFKFSFVTTHSKLFSLLPYTLSMALQCQGSAIVQLDSPSLYIEILSYLLVTEYNFLDMLGPPWLFVIIQMVQMFFYT